MPASFERILENRGKIQEYEEQIRRAQQEKMALLDTTKRDIINLGLFDALSINWNVINRIAKTGNR